MSCLRWLTLFYEKLTCLVEECGMFLNYYKSRMPLIIPALVLHDVCANCGLNSYFVCMVRFVWPLWVFLMHSVSDSWLLKIAVHKPRKTKKKKEGALLWDEKITIYGHILYDGPAQFFLEKIGSIGVTNTMVFVSTIWLCRPSWFTETFYEICWLLINGIFIVLLNCINAI